MMNKVTLSQEEIIYVISDIRATCALKSYCNDCQFYITGDGCALAHLPERWQIDDLIKKIRDGGDAE